MIGLSPSDSSRLAALDGALSFSVLLQDQRELTVGTAQSSVTGLLAAIQAAPADYARLLSAANEAIDAQYGAANKLIAPAWTEAPDTTRAAIREAVDGALAALIASARSEADAAVAQAGAAKNTAANPSSERTLAGDVENAANLLRTALSQLEANRDTQAAADLATARSQATSALSDARALLATLQAQTPPPADRIADTQAVIAAAEATFAATDNAERAITSSLAAPAGEAPTTFQLTSDTSPTTYLTTWGDSGTISLTDANGHGVLISSDGRVDTIPPSGNGWRFESDSTFLLPDGTKVSISPGTPASVLATRGQQRIEITNLQPGRAPAAKHHDGGGLAADAARNDGHVFVMGATPQNWTLAGAALGDEAAREVVATTPLEHEAAVDVTTITLPATLVTQLTSLGIDPGAFDTNHDGRFSNAELQALVATLDAAIGGAQARFDAALTNTAVALEALLRLNQFIEKLLAESDRRQANRQQAIAEERDQLLQIRREIDAAQTALRSAKADPSQPETKTSVLATARVVLNQIEHFVAEESARVTVSPAHPGANESPVATPPTPGTGLDPLMQALRRAERLLSGLGGATNETRFGPPSNHPANEPRLVELPVDASTPRKTQPQVEPNVVAEPRLTEIGVSLPATSRAPHPPAADASSRPPLPASPAPGLDVSPPDRISREAAQSVVEPPLRANAPVLNIPEVRSPTPGVSLPLHVSSTANRHTASPPASGPSGESPSRDFRPAASVSRVASIPSAEREPEVAPLPRPPSGQSPLPGTGFPATGPDPNVAPDPTFGAPDGFAREFRRRFDQHLVARRDQMGRARQLQSSVRQVVEQFLTLVNQDEQLRQVFNTNDLSDAQRSAFREKVESLERDLGLTWGGDPAKTPPGETNLNARALKSGMMI
jgi:multidrug efflux pump subunit AcrA (membrane-fusion protein)